MVLYYCFEVILMQITRSEARYKAMTILYQISLYEKNNISYNIEEVIN